MYFVNQKKHNKESGAWENDAHTKDTYEEAMHQFHSFMSTYAYKQDENLDFVSCSVEDQNGRIIRSEIDDRVEPVIIPAKPELESESEEEEPKTN